VNVLNRSGSNTVGLVLFAAIVIAGEHTAVRAADEPDNRVLVRVNGQPITESQLEALMASRRVPPEKRPDLRRPFLEQLVDQRLMRAFLAERKSTASELELDAEIRRIRELIQRSGETPEAVLGRLGYTEGGLREELALPLAWRSYARLLITPDRLRGYWAKHRRRFDGTEVRASQIFLKVRTADERTAALDTLRGLRERVVAGETSFAAAAREHSQAPTATAGGDVGWFPFRGEMPAEFARAAFGLKTGEISEPFVTDFGAHLLTVTGEKPGDLSLEDVRREVFSAFADELWDEIVAQQRAKAEIEWSAEFDQAAAPRD
jgi:parvulin-like peptidyl-prolyl isomerase